MLERAFVGFTVLCLTAPAGEISERESRKATRVGYGPIRVLHGLQLIVSFWAHFPIQLIQLWVARARSSEVLRFRGKITTLVYCVQ